tara:strand:- start:100 stop:354 length:255 start_codon:yes stop_codon:yes gene_type:complete
MRGVITASSMHVFMTKVYSFMGLGLFITAVNSSLLYNSGASDSLVYNISEVEGSLVIRSNWLGSVFFSAPLYSQNSKMSLNPRT